MAHAMADRAGTPEVEDRFDPVLMAVLANRFDAIVREMTNTLLRAGRSTVLAVARDFSCSIVTAEDELLAGAEGLPVHMFSSHLQTEVMSKLHDDVADGDAFLDNDPYLAGTHHADHTLLVPVFVDGVHLFTTVAKAHQADCGNSTATTFTPRPRDLYQEGALSFPCVRIQRDRRDVEDIIRMCRRRIRVPDQWYGDYLASLGAARVGERRLQELVRRYGVDTIREFTSAWFDYSERRMAAAIRSLPHGTVRASGRHDPVDELPDGVPINVEVQVDADQGRVTIDLRDNVDCVPAGLNQSRATATNNAMTGLFNVLEPDLPHNAGSFRRVEVLLRENCVVGIPVHPASCSAATTNIGDRLVGIIQSAFAQYGLGHGLAQSGGSQNLSAAMLYGNDARRGGEPFVNMIVVSNHGGPASPHCDGWLTFATPVCAGLLYRDSIEIDELRYPIHFESLRLVEDSGGAGRFRGGAAGTVKYTAKNEPIDYEWAIDWAVNPAQGVLGGHTGQIAGARKIAPDGEVVDLPQFGGGRLEPGQWLVSIDAGGCGYGDPLDREPALVLHDVLERWVSRAAAEEIYGCAFTGSVDDETLAVDEAGTTERRSQMRERR
ncbi:MAG TPA: hydantoinase B/oxoprolinase family protein [Baekduia sp.]|uniref:hydantoinase B/oxoprolinase family protein n=1 Tax=Baekduia sp. TaxID=2600305 RepID=UPI002D765D9E|nr:hydantoinase B/oxoprolinase family protein [Baekduia sp.]HET6509088.1 hydantoinase B/oxoprolinase family protein [Baekduia sp.]